MWSDYTSDLPVHGLQKSLLLRQLDVGDTEVGTHREAVLDAAEEEDLVWQPCLLQDHLRLVALLGREDLISLWRKLFVSVSKHRKPGNISKEGRVLTCSRDCKGTFDGLELVRLHETGVCAVSRINLSLLQEPHHILRPEAVSHGTNVLRAVFSAKLLESSCNDGINAIGAMGLHPLHNVKIRGAIQRDRVAMEKIRHHDEVAIRSELVSNELSVDKSVTDHVGDEEDRVLGRLVLGVREVSLDYTMLRSARLRSWSA